MEYKLYNFQDLLDEDFFYSLEAKALLEDVLKTCKFIITNFGYAYDCEGLTVKDSFRGWSFFDGNDFIYGYTLVNAYCK